MHKCTLRVSLNHLYIDVESANGSCEVRRHLRRSLEIMWTMEMESRRTPVRYPHRASRAPSPYSTIFCLGLWLNGPCSCRSLVGLEHL